jgi:hypothetical protein
MSQLTNTHQWIHTFFKNGIVIGFLAANTSSGQTKGILSRPMIQEENISYLPTMLNQAATWLTQQGKKSIQIGIPDEREFLMEELKNNGWVKTQSWVRLVKQINK